MYIIRLLLIAFGVTMPPAYADALEGKRSSAEILAEADADQWRTVDPAQILVFELERGRVSVELSDTFAQSHVVQMKTLVKSGFYDGLSFYRVIDGFVAQGGDVFETRELPEGTTRELRAEFSLAYTDLFELPSVVKDHYSEKVIFIDGVPVGLENTSKIDGVRREMWLLHCTGAMAMARDTPKDTGGTEFYITLQPQRYLDRNLTVFGKVIDGMQHLQALTRQAPPETEEDPLGETIIRAWMGDQLPEGEVAPAWQVLRTETQTFAEYVESRRNRPEAFFYHRPDHIDVCQLSIPVREKPAKIDEPATE